MSGESTDHTQDPDETSSVESAAAGTVDSIVPAFDVPAPELVDVPDAETAAADFAVPPPPTFETPAAPAAPRASVQEKLARAAPPAASSRAALRDAAAPDADRASVVPPPVQEGSSYRGWTIGIFFILAILLIGAVVLLVFLINTTVTSSAVGVDAWMSFAVPLV